jgi:hypothetical protein
MTKLVPRQRDKSVTAVLLLNEIGNSWWRVVMYVGHVLVRLDS